jgi:hypothetical protein
LVSWNWIHLLSMTLSVPEHVNKSVWKIMLAGTRALWQIRWAWKNIYIWIFFECLPFFVS